MRIGAWTALLLLTTACAPSRMRPETPEQPGTYRTSIRGGIMDGAARVTGVDAIPERDTKLAFVAIEHIYDGAGVGFRGSAFGGNWDLTNDGPNTQPEYSSLSFYPHFTSVGTTDLLRVPVRIGPEVRVHQTDQRSGPIGETTYRMYGLATELEPEWTFAQGDDFAASLYGRLHLGVGVGTIEGNLKNDAQLATNFGGEIGVRLQASVVSLSFGLQGHESRFARSNNQVGGRDPEALFTFGGVFLSLGAVF